MAIVERIKNILTKPAREWQVIKDEHQATMDLFRGYVAPLAAIPAIAGFIGSVFIGYRLFNQTYRVGFFEGLGQAIIMYLLTFVLIFVLGLVIDKLAGTFNGRPDQSQALKVAVYSYTPGWVAGIFLLIPSLAWIHTLASLYGVYLLYLGLGELMETPKDKALVYTAAVVVAAIVLALIIGAISAALFGVRAF